MQYVVVNVWFKYCQTAQEDRQLQNFDFALGMIAWEHISTALESVQTPTACCAASTKPWTETI